MTHDDPNLTEALFEDLLARSVDRQRALELELLIIVCSVPDRGIKVLRIHGLPLSMIASDELRLILAVLDHCERHQRGSPLQQAFDMVCWVLSRPEVRATGVNWIAGDYARPWALEDRIDAITRDGVWSEALVSALFTYGGYSAGHFFDAAVRDTASRLHRLVMQRQTAIEHFRQSLRIMGRDVGSPRDVFTSVGYQDLRIDLALMRVSTVTGISPARLQHELDLRDLALANDLPLSVTRQIVRNAVAETSMNSMNPCPTQQTKTEIRHMPETSTESGSPTIHPSSSPGRS